MRTPTAGPTVRILAAGLLVVALAGGCGGTSTERPAGVPVTGTPVASGGPSARQTPPPAAVPGSSGTPAASVPPGADPPPVADVHHVFPVAGRADYGRTHHDYPATDIFAACGSAVQAPADGVVLEVNRVDRFDPAHPDGADKGGLSVSIRGDDGVRYYGSHLAAIDPGVDAGTRLRAGIQIGVVGKTGNSSQVCHLHFGISPVCQRTGDWWVRRGVIFPWRYLDSWRAGGNLSPADEAAAWQRDHGCPTAPTPGTR
ncbi:M23 family metallopeptidase [Planosporangium sp. 12N6]|uniref:M23 family metallopeptidase n=1 Tax=Planosporangium spinosum TaxID=3402278 RepID=UPI003CF5B313